MKAYLLVNVSYHLTKLIKDICLDSYIAKKYQCKQTKTSHIVHKMLCDVIRLFLLMEVKADIMYNSTYCTMGATHKILYKRSSKSEGKKLFVDKTFNIWIRVPRKVLKLWRRGKIYHVGRGNTELRSILLCFFFNKMDFLKLYKWIYLQIISGCYFKGAYCLSGQWPFF